MKVENTGKLLTKEDPYMLHKTLGLFCFFHFAYRYIMLFMHNDMQLNNNAAAFCVGCHALLSVSSLIFRIPFRQHQKSPMIYKEFRGHSILFALRSIICYYLAYYDISIYSRMVICLLTSIGADVVTYCYKSNTTIRNMPFQKTMTEDNILEIKNHYSRMQVAATLFMLGNTNTAFSPLYAIQIAAFCMTLVRKSIINSNMWHIVYITGLWMNTFCFFSIKAGWFVMWYISTKIFMLMRFDNNVNKYISWIVAFCTYAILNEMNTAGIINNYLDNYGLLNIFSIVPPILYVIRNFIRYRQVFLY